MTSLSLRLTSLPPELLTYTLSYLDESDLRAVGCVCRSLALLACDPALWMALARSHLPAVFIYESAWLPYSPPQRSHTGGGGACSTCGSVYGGVSGAGGWVADRRGGNASDSTRTATATTASVASAPTSSYNGGCVHCRLRYSGPSYSSTRPLLTHNRTATTNGAGCAKGKATTGKRSSSQGAGRCYAGSKWASPVASVRDESVEEFETDSEDEGGATGGVVGDSGSGDSGSKNCVNGAAQVNPGDAVNASSTASATTLATNSGHGDSGVNTNTSTNNDNSRRSSTNSTQGNIASTGSGKSEAASSALSLSTRATLPPASIPKPPPGYVSWKAAAESVRGALAAVWIPDWYGGAQDLAVGARSQLTFLSSPATDSYTYFENYEVKTVAKGHRSAVQAGLEFSEESECVASGAMVTPLLCDADYASLAEYGEMGYILANGQRPWDETSGNFWKADATVLAIVHPQLGRVASVAVEYESYTVTLENGDVVVIDSHKHVGAGVNQRSDQLLPIDNWRMFVLLARDIEFQNVGLHLAF